MTLCKLVHRPMWKDNWASLLLSLSLLRSTQPMRLEAATWRLTISTLSSEEIKLLPVNVHGMRVGPGERGWEQALVHVISVIAGHRGHRGVLTQAIVWGRVPAPGGMMQPPVSVMIKWLLLDTGVTSGLPGARLRVSAASQTDAARCRRRCGQLVMGRGGGLGVTARH